MTQCTEKIKRQRCSETFGEDRLTRKRKFLEKYPDADVSKFKFQVILTDEGDIKGYETYFKLTEKDSFDITSDTFLNNKTWTKYLTSNKVKVKVSKDDKGFGIWYADGTRQPLKKNTTMINISKFKVYVAEGNYFETSLPQLTIGENTLDRDYKKNPYLIAIIAAYVSTYVCGISTQHMEYGKNTPGIITSMVRYHLYYQMSKFITDPSKLERYITLVPNSVKRYKPTHDVWVKAFYQGHMEILTWLSEQKHRDKLRNYKYHKNPRGVIIGISYEKISPDSSPNNISDYKKFIATTTDGLTKIGQKLLQQSIESYVYTVLGAQAKTRWPIVGEGAKSIQTQDVFHTIVRETIVQSNVTITISNMRTAIVSTNVVLNMAISPGMILVPSDLIQKMKIPGYNNIITLTTDKMKFGKNTDINYKAPIVIPKKSDPISIQRTKASTKTNRVLPLDDDTTTTPAPTPTPTFAPKPKVPIASVASEILGVTMMVGGFLFSNYIF